MPNVKISDVLAMVLAGAGITLAIQASKAKGQLGMQLELTQEECLELDGEYLSLVVMGDSLAFGLGADSYHDTPGAILSKYLSKNTGMNIKYTNIAQCGATSENLVKQTKIALALAPNLVLMIIGTNDITHAKSTRTGIRHLSRSIEALRNAGAEVYLVPCVDISIVSSIGQPLRSILGAVSKKYAKLQTIKALELGAQVVGQDPIKHHFVCPTMFAVDRFHPSSKGYKIISEHIISSIGESYEILSRPTDMGEGRSCV